MRVAILIVGILGSLIAFGTAGCALLCAASASGLSDLAAEAAAETGGSDEGVSELSSAAGSAMMGAIGSGLQGLLGLIGAIMAFSKLGKGSDAKMGGGMIFAGVLIAIIMGIAAGGDAIGVVIGIVIMGGELHLLAALLAFVAKPKGGASGPEPEPVAV
ncbi:MAG: hypothetical protein QF685_05945 [Verrucomicrobiota bacterium]|jgi:hypothetical protein|nr:hypothetical protein [Verrucomicrobiota bacterium]